MEETSNEEDFYKIIGFSKIVPVNQK